MTTRGNAPPADSVRVSALVARLYHVHDVRQREIGLRLGMSQARVSRLLRQAEELGIVRTTVAVPEGIHAELEEAVESRYAVPEVHVVDVPPGADLPTALGRSAARQLADVLSIAMRIGFTSWSTTLQAMALAMPEQPRTGGRLVVEMLGDLGPPDLQHRAARSTQRFADALGTTPVFLRTPGVAITPALGSSALRDAHVRYALRLLDDLDVAFIGVGPADLHSGLRGGDGYFTVAQLEQARAAGAVGQINQRFLDAAGAPVSTPLDGLVVGATLAQVRSARRRVVVAGGVDKRAALRAALAGGWVDLLITDVVSALALVGRGSPGPLPKPLASA